MGEKSNGNFPFEHKRLSPQENQALEDMQGVSIDYITVGPKAYFFHEHYMNEAANIYNMKLRPDDTFVATYPKSGTTWTQDLVWLLQNNLDFGKAKSIPLNVRFPYLEINTFMPEEEFNKENPDPKTYALRAFGTLNVKKISELPSPRFMKTHLPLSLLPPALLDTVKVVYVCRDPRDVAVSLMYHMKLTKWISSETEFKNYWKCFMKNHILYSPYFGHVLEAWEKRNHQNLLFLFYEDLLEDLPAGIRRVAQFLGKEITEEQVTALNEHLKFDNFKNNKSVNLQDFQEKGLFNAEGGFVRKGKKGGWREYFDEEMTAQADKWIEDNLRDTDFRFPYM